MSKTLSAGVLLYKINDGVLEVWVAHMGGPFWSKKDDGAWSIPKGEYTDEAPRTAALREFHEEIGSPAPDVEYFELGEFKQSSGKLITVFAAETDFIVDKIVSNTFELEWPRGSGVVKNFPEIDDARWFTVLDARRKLVKGQVPALDALESYLHERGIKFNAEASESSALFDLE